MPRTQKKNNQDTQTKSYYKKLYFGNILDKYFDKDDGVRSGFVVDLGLISGDAMDLKSPNGGT